MTFLGYRIRRNYRWDTGHAYIGTCPHPASVQSICRRVSELIASRNGLLSPKEIVTRLNRLLTGWANYVRIDALTSETNARFDTVAGAIQSLQREIGTLRWMIGVGFALLSVLVGLATLFLRFSGTAVS